MLKKIIKDICSKDIKEYWKSEGCNKRMRRYVLIKQILFWLQLTLMLVVATYILFITTDIIIRLFNDKCLIVKILNYFGSQSIQKPIINIYQIIGIVILITNLIYSKLKAISLYDTFKNIIRNFLGLPIILLLTFSFIVVGKLMFTFWLLVGFFVFNFVINLYNSRIKELYHIASGKEK